MCNFFIDLFLYTMKILLVLCLSYVGSGYGFNFVLKVKYRSGQEMYLIQKLKNRIFFGLDLFIDIALQF